MHYKRIIGVVILSSLILTGCSNTNRNTAKSSEEVINEESIDVESSDKEITDDELSDEEKKELVKSIAADKQGTITFNSADKEKLMTASLYYELMFEHFDEQELYDMMNDAFGLTDEQYVEDYETFWSILRENYPYFGYLKEQGLDPEKEYSDGLKLIKAYPSAFSLQKLIQNTAYNFSYTGHLNCIHPDKYDESKELYAHMSPWNKMYEEKCVVDNLDNWKICTEYTKAWASHVMDMENESDEVLNAAQESDEAKAPAILGEIEQGEAYPSNENVSTNIVLDDKCAYLKPSTFVTWEEDQDVIDEFMGQIGNCDNLIIDLRGNGGGNDFYWYNLVGYLTDKKMFFSKYGLTNVTDLNKPFIISIFGLNSPMPISKIPQELTVKQSDLDATTSYAKNYISVMSEKKPCGFNGKIWLIVDSDVYSAAESFTMFCKQNQFATIVGSYTGGDGCFMDPINFALPNTGLMFRFSTFIALNPDGSNNEEKGTTPDILLEDGDNAIDTIFDLIK